MFAVWALIGTSQLPESLVFSFYLPIVDMAEDILRRNYHATIRLFLAFFNQMVTEKTNLNTQNITEPGTKHISSITDEKLCRLTLPLRIMFI